jgi:predicted phosphodiesterase
MSTNPQALPVFRTLQVSDSRQVSDMDLELLRLWSLKEVSRTVERFRVFANTCTDPARLLEVFQQYRRLILAGMRLRIKYADDQLQADVMEITDDHRLVVTCATEILNYEFDPGIKLELSQTQDSFTKPGPGMGMAAYSVWSVTSGSMGVIVAEDVRESADATFFREVIEAGKGLGVYEPESVPGIYRKPVIAGSPPYRSILSVPIMRTINALGGFESDERCIGVLNLTHNMPKVFSILDCAWATAHASLVGSLYNAFVVKSILLTGESKPKSVIHADSITRLANEAKKSKPMEAPKDTYRFIHVSDIHFGQKMRDGKIKIQEGVKKSVREDVALVLRKDTKDKSVDGVLVTGDVAFSAQKKQYDAAAEWLRLLTEEVKCDPKKVWIIPGNHDVDREAIRPIDKLTIKEVRESPLEKSIQLADEMVSPGSGFDHLSKFKNYCEFAKNYETGEFPDSSNQLWRKELHFDDKRKLVLVGLNSAIFSCEEDQAYENKRSPHEVMGERQYLFFPDKYEEVAVLFHHPPACLIDSAGLQRCFANIRVAIWGHMHFPDALTMKRDRATFMIQAGAVAPGEQNYDYCYNIIEFAKGEPADNPSLIVRVFPRKWSHERMQFEPDSKHRKLNASNCFEETIDCQRWSD